MEFITGFVVGLISSYWFLGIAICFLVVSEFHESGFTYLLYATVVAGVMIAFDLSFNPWLLVAYIPIGIVWSLWRYRKFVAQKATELLRYNEVRRDSRRDSMGGNELTEAQISSLSIQGNIDKATYWILFWPTNMLIHLTQDLWEAFGTFIKTKLAHLYDGIRNAELEKLKR